MSSRLTFVPHAALLAALTWLLGQAQPPAVAVDLDSQWLARGWQTADGLPNNTVVSVVQTPDGYLWLGTPTGLARFDGAQFQEFPSSNFVAAPNRGVLTMIGSQDGGLCLAMDRGAIVRLNAGAARVFLPGRDVPDEPPYMLAEDREGALWVSYRQGAVCRILDGKVTRFTAKDGLPAPTAACALVGDVQGRLWFIEGGCFGSFGDGRFHTVHRFPSAAACLAPSRSGGVWICSGPRLFKYDETGELQDLGSFTSERGEVEPSALIEDSSGGVWIGTSFSGLFHFDGSQFEAVPITHGQIMSLGEDDEGNLWVGTTGAGLDRVRPRAVELEGTESGLPFETVQSLCQDTNGVIWAVTQNGSIARRTNGHWKVFIPKPGLNLDANCITADPQGRIWIGTQAQGLYCWHDDRLIEWGRAEGLRGSSIHTLQFDKSGDLWIGEEAPNMVQRLRAGRITTPQTPSEDLRFIRAMTEDAYGTVWVGTSRGALLRASGNQLVDATPKGLGSTASIRCLAAAPDGSVWIGFAGWGVGRLKDGRFADITAQQGLYDDYISHIVADGRGWLWFGGDRGIFRVRQTDLDDVADGRASRVRSIHYGRSEGLPSLQGSFGGAPDVLRSRDGRLWIPMRTALAVVIPDRLRENLRPPPVRLTRVTVDESTRALYSDVVPDPESLRPGVLDLSKGSHTLRLPAGYHQVQFDFTALSLTAPENVHFRHRLDSVDEGWVEDGTKRSANYTSLGEGKYEFHVIACNSDGVWNQTGDSLSLVVAPFFWQTWTFRILAFSLFTLFVIAIVRYVSFRHLRLEMRKLEQQAALHQERARIAKDIHDDVGANLTQIALLSELAQQDQKTPPVSRHINLISSTARQAIKSLDEIVWAVNPRNDTLAHLIDYTGQYAVDFLRPAGIRCRLDLPEQAPAREISTDVRHNLFLVVKEALNNIVKHANAGEVWLRIHASDAGLRILIEDDGRGFDESPSDAGADGLRNIQQRLGDLGGQCRIESRVGAGTKVVVEVPWPRAPE